MPVFWFWFYLTLTSGIVMLPEIFLIKMTFWQSLIARSGAVATNVAVAVFFADINSVSRSIDRLISGAMKIQKKSLAAGVKLTLLGPHIYLLKLLLCNFLLFPWLSGYVEPIDWMVLERAYFYSLGSCFLVGMIYGLIGEIAWKKLLTAVLPKRKQLA